MHCFSAIVINDPESVLCAISTLESRRRMRVVRKAFDIRSGHCITFRCANTLSFPLPKELNLVRPAPDNLTTNNGSSPPFGTYG